MKQGSAPSGLTLPRVLAAPGHLPRFWKSVRRRRGLAQRPASRGGVSMQCTRFYLYFAAILEFVEKPGAGRLLSDQGRDGGVRLISPAFGLRTFVALLLSGVTFFPVQKQCGIL